MENDQKRFFGDRVARSYDHDARPDTPATVDFLAGLAGVGPVLELAIGTGRVALPLAARGLRVDGLDISEAMVGRLREKTGGTELEVRIQDMSSFEMPGPYRLVYVVWNSFCNLGDQDSQVNCFETVARHLADDGVFVIEGFVPEPEWLRDGQYVRAEMVDTDEVWLDVVSIDAVEQRLDESHVGLSSRGIELHPVVTRYVWPSELDLMARLARLHRVHRWAGWSREPFTSASPTYVVVYGR